MLIITSKTKNKLVREQRAKELKERVEGAQRLAESQAKLNAEERKALRSQDQKKTGAITIFENFKNDIDSVMEFAKEQSGKHYRLISTLSPENVASRVAAGYEFVSPQDPEAKGTLLEERFKSADGQIKIGSLALARTSEENAQRREAQKLALANFKLRRIQDSYHEKGEAIKRQLGPAHEGFKTFVKEE